MVQNRETICSNMTEVLTSAQLIYTKSHTSLVVIFISFANDISEKVIRMTYKCSAAPDLP